MEIQDMINIIQAQINSHNAAIANLQSQIDMLANTKAQLVNIA